MSQIIISTIMFLMGIPVLFFGLKKGYDEYVFYHEGFEQVEGQVISMSEKQEKSGKTYAPVFQYVTKKGEEFTYNSQAYLTMQPYKIGDKAPIMYNANNPQNARSTADSDIWIFSILYAFIGLGIISFAVWLFFKDKT